MKQGLSVISFFLLLTACTEIEQQWQLSGEWVPLFNGTDLNDWEVVGAGQWTVEDGEIVQIA